MSFRHSSPPTRHKHPKMDAKNGSRTTPPPPHPGPAVAQLRTRVWKLPEAATLGPAQAPTRKRQPRGLDAQLTTEQRAPLAPAPEASSIERPDARRTCHFNHLAATLQLTYSGIGPRAMAHSEGCPQKECAAARNVFHVLDAGSVTSRILDPGPLIRSTPFERHPAFLCVLDETRRFPISAFDGEYSLLRAREMALNISKTSHTFSFPGPTIKLPRFSPTRFSGVLTSAGEPFRSSESSHIMMMSERKSGQLPTSVTVVS